MRRDERSAVGIDDRQNHRSPGISGDQTIRAETLRSDLGYRTMGDAIDLALFE
jgi:hypothetical protein